MKRAKSRRTAPGQGEAEGDDSAGEPTRGAGGCRQEPRGRQQVGGPGEPGRWLQVPHVREGRQPGQGDTSRLRQVRNKWHSKM